MSRRDKYKQVRNHSTAADEALRILRNERPSKRMLNKLVPVYAAFLERGLGTKRLSWRESSCSTSLYIEVLDERGRTTVLRLGDHPPQLHAAGVDHDCRSLAELRAAAGNVADLIVKQLFSA